MPSLIRNTPPLHELQRRFANAVFDPADDSFNGMVRANGLRPAARLGVYRNNLDVGMAKVLRATYPVTERLVGEQFFGFAARRFVDLFPSRSGDLNDFGSEFADFLREFEPARGLPYLEDVATLELAHYRAYHAAGHAALDIAALQQVTPDRHEDLRFKLHPSLALIASEYPVLRIWQVNRPDWDGDQTVDLAEGKSTLMVLRPNLEVLMEPLAAGEYALLHALAQGETFGNACGCAVDAEADCDVGSVLSRAVAGGAIVGFTV